MNQKNGAVILPGIILLLALSLSCRGEKSASGPAGVILFSRGEVQMIRDGRSIVAGKGGEVFPGDEIRTGSGALAIIRFRHRAVEMEIQSDAALRVEKYEPAVKTFYREKGNLWLRVNRRDKNEVITIRSPTAVASVRGTKFYSFALHDDKAGDLAGMCHCEGDVDYRSQKGAYHETHPRDSMAFTGEKATVLLMPHALKAAGLKIKHHHSLIGDSPLGPQEEKMSPAAQAALRSLIRSRFSSLN